MRGPRAATQRGTALLLAMVILTLVSTVAAGMVWAQQRAIEVEAAERARAQATWILNSALDWARLILREDGRSGGPDHLGEPWAVPLAEARLSTFLAAERDPVATDDGPDAFLSGRISDLQARYNLRNLVDAEGAPRPDEVAVLQRICDNVGVSAGVATTIATALGGAWRGGEAASLAPHTLAQLSWLGIDPGTLRLLEPVVVLLPQSTTVNVNTASREVLAAVFDGIDRGAAERLVQLRQRAPFRSYADIQKALPDKVKAPEDRVGVTTRFFEVIGRLRLDDRVLIERSIIERRNRDAVVILRERRSALDINP